MASAKQTGNGKWRARWRDDQGRTQGKSGFRLKSEALRFGNDQERTVALGTYIDQAAGKLTLATYAEGWMASRHLAAFPPGPEGLVLTYHDGRPVKRNRFGAMWRQTEGRADLDFRYHDLRHHFASALIAGGCSVKSVQKALGHASAKVTMDTYAHLWPDSDDLTRAAVQAALGKSVSVPVSTTVT